jgi:hypothetical protein
MERENLFCLSPLDPSVPAKVGLHSYLLNSSVVQDMQNSNYQDIQISGMAVSDVGSHVLQALDMEQVLCGQHGKLFAAKLSTQKVADLLLKFQQKISN